MSRQSTTAKISRRVAKLLASSIHRGEGVIVRHKGRFAALDNAPLNVEVLWGTATSTNRLLLTIHHKGGKPETFFAPLKELTIRKATIEALEAEYAKA